MTTTLPYRRPASGVSTPGALDWLDDAACRDADPGFWDPEVVADPSIAKTICAGCPVIAACAQRAVAVKATHGIWAGVPRTTYSAGKK